jgi:hypothetical protein
MYKNKNNKTSFSKVKRKGRLKWLLLLVVLMGTLTGGAVWYKVHRDRQKTMASVEADNAEKQEAEDLKKAIIAENNTDNSGSQPTNNEDPLKGGSGEQQPAVAPSTGTATMGEISFNQAGGVIKASLPISGVSGGTCKFSFTVTDERPVIKDVAFGSGACLVEVPEVEFSFLGEWDLTVSYGGQTKTKSIKIE